MPERQKRWGWTLEGHKGHTPPSLPRNGNGKCHQLQILWGTHQQGPEMDHPHGRSGLISLTASLLTPQNEEIQHGLQDTVQLLAVHHREYPGLGHQGMVWAQL